MNVDFEYLNTFEDGHTERSAQNQYSSTGGFKSPVSSVKVPIEHIDITLQKDRDEYEGRGFNFVEFFPTDDGEMYYPGWATSNTLSARVEAKAKEVRSAGSTTVTSLIGNGGCTNYWTTRGIALYAYPFENIPRITNPKKIDITTVRQIEKATPHGFKFKEYLPNIPYNITSVKGDILVRNHNFYLGVVKKIRTEMPGYYIHSKNLYIRKSNLETGYVQYEDVGYAIYIAKKPKPLI
jgi:hypothetical protein